MTFSPSAAALLGVVRGLPITTARKIVTDLLLDHEDESTIARIVQDAQRVELLTSAELEHSVRGHAAAYGAPSGSQPRARTPSSRIRMDAWQSCRCMVAERHCCIEAKAVLTMHQSSGADPSATLENRNKPGVWKARAWLLGGQVGQFGWPERSMRQRRTRSCDHRAHLAARVCTSWSAASTASVTSVSLGSSQPHIAALTRQSMTPGRRGDGGSGMQPPLAR